MLVNFNYVQSNANSLANLVVAIYILLEFTPLEGKENSLKIAKSPD